MKSILVIDDDEDIGDALMLFLQDEGYEIRLASSGKQGLIFVQEKIPDLIILDWQMPKMSGDEVLKNLEKIPNIEKTPIILMSANIARIPCESLRARKHLNKPFNMGLITNLIAEVLAEDPR